MSSLSRVWRCRKIAGPAMIGIVLTAVGVAQNVDVRRVVLTPCEIDEASGKGKQPVLCGRYEVFEDRAARSGRKIPIKIVVFAARSSNKEPDPLFYVPGGPGSSATEDAPYVAEDFAAIREKRDLVFVDQRGTGGSNQLFCELFDPNDVQSYLGHWNPPARVRECRKQLEKTADLKLYGTSVAADDLDEIRRALGYGKINLAGASYGTRAVMEYVRRHGSSVRAVVLHGVSPFDQFMPKDFPWHTERALNGVLGECLADTECKTAFPTIKDDARLVLGQLRKGPIDVRVMLEGKPLAVRLSRDLAAEAIRYMLYQSGAASRIPAVLNEASSGNFRPLAEAAILYRKFIVATGATGLYLSITCAEDLPFAGADNKAAAESTFLGSYRLKQQREACAEWPRATISKGYATLVRSSVPAIIYSGQWDPVTPPEYGEKVSRLLPNSLHIVVPGGGHGYNGLSGLECIFGLTRKFIESASAKELDTACVSSIKRTGFPLKLEN